MTGERYFDIGFCEYSKYFLLLYSLLHVVQELYAVFSFQKLLGFDNVVIKFYLNFLSFQTFGV